MADHISDQRLGDLVAVRWFLVAGTLLAILVSLISPWNLPIFTLALLVCIMVVLNVFFQYKLSRRQSVSFSTLLFGLILDGLILFGIIALTGGSHNPFALFFLLQVIFAAQALPLKWTWFFSIYVTALYLLLFIVDYAAHTGHDHDPLFSLHLIGMLVSFAFLCFFITNYVAKTTHRLRRVEVQAKEDEKLVLLGAFAAQAAHQLGTPLSSIGMLLEKVRKYPNEKTLDIMKNELFRCKNLIQELADKTAQDKATSGGRYYLSEFIKESVDKWKRRNNTSISVSASGRFDKQIVLDKTFEYAFMNLLDNSAEAGANSIQVKLKEDTASYTLIVLDDGPGFPGAVRNEKKKGLGLYLTEATIKKMGGTIELTNLTDAGGASVALTLPKEKVL